MWFDDAVDQRVGMGRVRDALDMGADTLVVACPFCILMTAVGIAAEDGKVRVNETAELLAESIDTNESD